MINWTCNLCGQGHQNDIQYFHREVGLCLGCGSNVRFRAIWYLIESYILSAGQNTAIEIIGVGLSDAELYARKLAQAFNYQNTYFHQEPFLDITDRSSASNYKNLDFVICSDVLEHVDMPVENAFQNLNLMLKQGGFLIFSVPYFTDAISKQTIEHFPAHKNSRVSIEDGREYLILDNKIAHANLCWHGGAGNVLEKRVFAESAVKKHLADNNFIVTETCEDQPSLGIIYNQVGSKIMICVKQ